MDSLILHCKNVTKKIGKKGILKNINLDVYKNDIVGLVGLNGAGKTTLIKVLLSLQKVDSGNIEINGYNLKNNFVKAIEKVGAIVEIPTFYNYLTGLENIKIKMRMYKNIPNERISEVIELLELKEFINNKVSKYSLGMKQRLAIALSLINNPNLLILDEPTNGLDTEGIITLKRIIMKLSNSGASIIISSHALSELESICNKICIIKNGQIIQNKEIDKIKSRNNSYIFEVSNIKNINLLFKYEIISDNKFKVWCNKEFIPLIIESLINSHIKVYSVVENILSLEEIFIEELGGDIND